MRARLPSRTHEFRANHLWSPTSSPAYENWEYVKEQYGERNQLVLYARRPRGGNIFEVEALRELIKAHEWTVSQCNVDTGSRRLRWKHVCHKHKRDTECASQNFLRLWNYDVNTLEERRHDILDDVSAMHHSGYNVDIYAGEPRFDGKGANKEVERADGVMLVYELEGTDGDAAAFESSWHAGIDAVVNKRWVEISHVSPGAHLAETERAVLGDLPLFAIGLGIALFYLVVTLGSLNSCVKSRLLLGVASVLHVALALGAGFGIAALAGVPLTTITPVLPLALLGVSVDALVAIVSALDAEDPTHALEQRVERAFGSSAPAILLTTLTSVAACVIGSTVDTPGVSYFCAYAASCFAMSLLATASFFLSLLVLDEKRMRASRWSALPCVTGQEEAGDDGAAKAAQAPPADSGAPVLAARRRAALERDVDAVVTGPVGRFVHERYAPALLTPWVSALVIAIFIVLNALTLSALPRLHLGLPETDVLPDDSYVATALRVESESFGGPLVHASVVLRNESIRSLDVRTRLDKALDAMQDEPFVTYGFDRWHVIWKKELQARDSARNDGTKYNAHKFTNGLGEWLQDNTRYLDDVVCDDDDECKEPLTERYALLYKSAPSGEPLHALRQRDRLESQMRRRDLDAGFVFHESYLVEEGAAAIWRHVSANIVGAIGAVLVLMLVFAPPLVALFTTLCVFSSTVLLAGAPRRARPPPAHRRRPPARPLRAQPRCAPLTTGSRARAHAARCAALAPGAMIAADIRLNPVAFVNIVLSVALSVYYVAPIGSTYEIALLGATQRGAVGRAANHEAASFSLVAVAVSVIKGGWATILGARRTRRARRARRRGRVAGPTRTNPCATPAASARSPGIFVLAFASSVAFRTFFAMLAFVVLLGVLHGVVLMPCLLAHLSTMPGCGRAESTPPPAAHTAPPAAPVEVKTDAGAKDKPATSASAWPAWLGGARV